MKQFYVYIVTNGRNGTLYTGVTSDLQKRIWEHKNKVCEGFTKKYNLTHLVYHEIFEDAETAITREKELKGWKRQWKLELIENKNPEWCDLYEGIH